MLTRTPVRHTLTTRATPYLRREKEEEGGKKGEGRVGDTEKKGEREEGREERKDSGSLSPIRPDAEFLGPPGRASEHVAEYIRVKESLDERRRTDESILYLSLFEDDRREIKRHVVACGRKYMFYLHVVPS